MEIYNPFSSKILTYTYWASEMTKISKEFYRTFISTHKEIQKERKNAGENFGE